MCLQGRVVSEQNIELGVFSSPCPCRGLHFNFLTKYGSLGADVCVLVGEDEVTGNYVCLKNMANSNQVGVRVRGIQQAHDGFRTHGLF